MPRCLLLHALSDYRVRRIVDSDPDAQYFVCRINADGHARSAVHQYVVSVRDEDAAFSDDLLSWLAGAPLPGFNEHMPNSRRFVLDRESDETGVSGTGVVADAVEFDSGWVVLSWRADDGTGVGVYPDTRAVERIHGHDGKTIVRWSDRQ